MYKIDLGAHSISIHQAITSINPKACGYVCTRCNGSIVTATGAVNASTAVHCLPARQVCFAADITIGSGHSE